MNALLSIAFLLACVLGTLAAWRASLSNARALIGVVVILCAAGLAGAITVAAEGGSAAARYLGLAAVLLAATAFTGAVMAVRRDERRSDD